MNSKLTTNRVTKRSGRGKPVKPVKPVRAVAAQPSLVVQIPLELIEDQDKYQDRDEGGRLQRKHVLHQQQDKPQAKRPKVDGSGHFSLSEEEWEERELDDETFKKVTTSQKFDQSSVCYNTHID